MRHERHRAIGLLASLALRLYGRCVRLRLVDRAGLFDRRDPPPPAIWCFWHNRILMIPLVYRRKTRHRPGAALTSPSGDGSMIAETVARFGIGAIRGSSSRRGAPALIEARHAIESGSDIAIAPDGPRGPRYRFGPGAIFLAQVTGAPIIPIRVDYSRFHRLKTWDGFLLPTPLSRVSITFEPPHHIPPTSSEEAFEAERVRIEKLMRERLLPE